MPLDSLGVVHGTVGPFIGAPWRVGKGGTGRGSGAPGVYEAPVLDAAAVVVVAAAAHARRRNISHCCSTPIRDPNPGTNRA